MTSAPDSATRLQADVGRALLDARWSELERRCHAALVLINQCSLEAAQAALSRQHSEDGAAGYDVSLFDNVDVEYSVLAAGRKVRAAQRANRQKLHVIEGCAAAAKALAISRAGCARPERFHIGVRITRGRPVANDNDATCTEQAWWHTQVQGAWVQRQKERREARDG